MIVAVVTPLTTPIHLLVRSQSISLGKHVYYLKLGLQYKSPEFVSNYRRVQPFLTTY